MTALDTLLKQTNTRHVTQATIDGVCIPAFEDGDKHLIVFDARVKSGKLISILATIAWCQNQERNTAHIVVSAWNRRADQSQRRRLEKAGAIVVQLTRHSEAQKAADIVNSALDTHDEVIIYHDELDHGSGSGQIVESFYNQLDLYDERIRRIYYSATAEELLSGAAYCSWPDADKLHYKYIPPPEYKGAEYYLDAGLHRDVDRAIVFHVEIVKKVWSEKRQKYVSQTTYANPQPSEQLAELIDEALETAIYPRRVIVIRQRAYYSTVKRAIQCDDLLNHERIVHLFSHSVHGEDTIDWADPAAFDEFDEDKLVIVWIDMECGRSTEWGIHESLYAYHNFAGETTAYNTSIQQAGRVFHYVGTKYKEPQPIILYCRREDLELHAGRTTHSSYTMKLSGRMTTKVLGSSGAAIVQREFEPVIVVSNIEFNDKISFLEELGECIGRELPLSELGALRRWSDGDSESKHKSMGAMNAIVAGTSRKPCGGMPKNSKTIFIEYIEAPFPLRDGSEIEPGTAFVHIATIIESDSDGDSDSTEPAALHQTGKKSMYFEGSAEDDE